MTANEKRQKVVDVYKTILGRNYYSQAKRDYCFKKYKDGKYYSDCSSSISYCYKEAGFSFGILNTVGMYQCKKFTEVDVTIKNGQIQNPEVLRIGDMLLFAGGDSGRSYAGFVGHVELCAEINGNSVTLYGHGSGRPSKKDMKTYCKSRYNTKASTKLGNRGLIKVVRFIQDDDSSIQPTVQPTADTGNTIKITGGSVNIRYGAAATYKIVKVAHKNDIFEKCDTTGWTPIVYDEKVRWVSSKYVSNSKSCTANALNVRVGAGTSYSTVGTVKKGYNFEVPNTNGWTPIVVNREVAWVSNKYIA